MFTWVCQRCGKSVDVSHTKCPNCEPETGADTELGSARGAAAAAPAPPKATVARTLPPPPPHSRGPVADVAPGPAPPEQPGDVFSLRLSHLLVFMFALLAAVAGAIFLSQPELAEEWKQRLTAASEPDENAPVALPEPGAVEVTGIRAWRDESAELRIRASLINHQISPYSQTAFEVQVFGRAGDGMGRLLGSFSVELDEPIAGRSARDVEAELDALDGLAEFPHWSELTGRINLETPGGTP